MEWIKQGSYFTGSRHVEIKSIRVADEQGETKRFRVSTVRDGSSGFTKIPAAGKLYKSDKGHVGILIAGKNAGYVKVGKNLAVQQSVVVSPNCISKKPLKQLLSGTHIEIMEIDGTIVGIEK